MGTKAQAWLERGATARRIAQTLDRGDAQILERFAEECGVRAACLSEESLMRQHCLSCPLARTGRC